MALKDALKRRSHKERSQPGSRRKYGLLEKKKDYILRARDFHKKESAIKVLRRKAEEKNPDEFYFAMEKARTRNGIHEAPTAEANAYTQDELRLMKTQDVGYLTVKSQTEKKKMERLKQNLHGLSKDAQNTHTVFVDSESELESFDPSKHFDTPADLLDRTFNRPRTNQLANESLIVSSLQGESLGKAAARVSKQTKRAYEELKQREKREKALTRTREHLESQKKAMSSGRRVKVSGHGDAIKQYRWKSERKR